MGKDLRVWAASIIGQTVGGRFYLDRLIGAGGMGAVFEGTHMTMGRAVAVKLLAPHLLEHNKSIMRFKQEARAAAATAHRGVVEVIDFDHDPTHGPFLVMELLKGEPLSSRIARRGGKLDPREALPIAAEITATLASVHEHNVVHRDLKPANIFLAAAEGVQEVVKILDFGISRISQRKPATKLTVPGQVLGTPRYMAPEQAACEPDVDLRADIYGVGVVLYEALSGTRPYADVPANEVLAKVVLDSPKPLAEAAPSLPKQVVALVEIAMARDRSGRFSNADAMHTAINEAVKDLDGSLTPPIVGPSDVSVRFSVSGTGTTDDGLAEFRATEPGPVVPIVDPTPDSTQMGTSSEGTGRPTVQGFHENVPEGPVPKGQQPPPSIPSMAAEHSSRRPGRSPADLALPTTKPSPSGMPQPYPAEQRHPQASQPPVTARPKGWSRKKTAWVVMVALLAAAGAIGLGLTIALCGPR